MSSWSGSLSLLVCGAFGTISLLTTVVGQGTTASCPPGFFSNSSSGSSICAMCPPGTISSTVGATACSACHSGSFAPAPAMSSCLQCLPGTFSPSLSVAISSSIAPNTSAFGTQGSSSCALCPRGSFSKAGAAGCTECPTRSFADDEGLSTCRVCEKGTYQSSVGSSYCSVCPYNTAAPSTGMTSCEQCANSSFTNNRTGFEHCVSCPLGQFLGVVNQTTREQGCVVCPDHAICSGSVVVADAGYWSAGLDVFACRSPEMCVGQGQCGENRVQPASENFLCENCIEGYLARGHECIPCDQAQVPLIITVAVFSLFFIVVCQVTAAFLAGNHLGRAKQAGLVVTMMLFMQYLAMLTASQSLSYLAPLRIFLLDTTAFNACVVPTSPELFAFSGILMIAVWFASNFIFVALVHIKHSTLSLAIWLQSKSIADQENPNESRNSKDNTNQTRTASSADRDAAVFQEPKSTPEPSVASDTALERDVRRTKYAFVIGLILVQLPVIFNVLNADSCEPVQMGTETRKINKLAPEIDCENFGRYDAAYLAIYDITLFGLPLLFILGHKLRWACFDWARILFRNRSIMFPLLEIYTFNLLLSIFTQLWQNDEFFAGKYAFLIGFTMFRLLRFSKSGDFKWEFLNEAVAAQMTYLTIILLLLLGFGPDYSSTAKIIIIIAIFAPFILLPFYKEKSPRDDPQSSHSQTSLPLKDATSSNSVLNVPSRTVSLKSLSQSSVLSESQSEDVALEIRCHSNIDTSTTATIPAHTNKSHCVSLPSMVQSIHQRTADAAPGQSEYSADVHGVDFDFEIEDNLVGTHSVRTSNNGGSLSERNSFSARAGQQQV